MDNISLPGESFVQPCLAVDLVYDITAPLYSQWLTLSCLAKLDSAIANRQLRPKFLSMLHINGLIFHHQPVVKPYAYPGPAYYQWLKLRGISVDSFKFGSRIDDEALAAIASEPKITQHVKSLDFLLASYTSLNNLDAVVCNCPQLESFALCETRASNVVLPSTLLALASHCPNLKELNLQHNRHIDATTAQKLATGCPDLEALKFYFCYGVDDAALSAFAQGCPRLRTLLVKGNDQIASDGIAHVAEHCQQLRVVNLAGSSHLGDEGVAPLLLNCPHLEVLQMDFSCITDLTLQAIGLHCINLKELSVVFCGNVTDDGLRCIRDGCPSLEVLNVQCCRFISQVACDALRAQRPSLHLKSST